MGRMNSRGKGGDDGELPRGWSQPDAAERGSEWSAPGNERGLDPAHDADPAHPFTCVGCGAHLGLAGAYAHDGNIYCFECRPDGAVSSDQLPSDDTLLTTPERRRTPRTFVGRLFRALFSDRLSSRGPR